jgi:ribosomal protein S12
MALVSFSCLLVNRLPVNLSELRVVTNTLPTHTQRSERLLKRTSDAVDKAPSKKGVLLKILRTLAVTQLTL